MELKNLTRITLQADTITDFATARNAELARAKTEWVFFVDSDETVSPELEREVQEAIKSTKYDAYSIHRVDTFMGRQLRYGETGHAQFVRLARKSYGEWQRPVHEVWVGKGKIGKLQHPLLHNAHPSISSFLDKINRYSKIEAEYRRERGRKSSLFAIAVYPIAKFKFNYLVRRGFVDGVPGLILAMMMSYHSYLTWTKLYLLQKQSMTRSN